MDVKVPPQNTGLGPEKTSFFQALQIPTKIAKGTIEILVCDGFRLPHLAFCNFYLQALLSFQAEVHLVKKGDKVGASEANLLNMLKIYPFSYGLVIRQVYDNGSIYEPAILDITTDVLRGRIMEVR